MAKGVGLVKSDKGMLRVTGRVRTQSEPGQRLKFKNQTELDVCNLDVRC